MNDALDEVGPGRPATERDLPVGCLAGGGHTGGDRSRWTALVVLCAGMLMIVLDMTVVNVALPDIQNDLGFTQAGLAWVVNAYLIAFGGLLLLAGRLGDMLSRRDMFLTGLGVFTVASLLCGAAHSQEMLVLARFVQGVGGAMTSAVILGMIVTMFPEPRERARAIGVYAFVASAGGSIGLIAGGVLTQAVGWHWIFLVNVPIGLVTAGAAVRLLERDTGIGLGRGADVLGAVLITAALVVGIYTIVEPAAKLGWGAALTWKLAVVAVALLVAFVVREARAAHPLIPLSIFRSRDVTGANLIQALTVAGMFGVFFLGALYLQRVQHYDALGTGLAFLPTTLVMGALSVRYADRLIMRFGPRRILSPGLVIIAAGLGWLVQVPVQGSYLLDVFPAMTCSRRWCWSGPGPAAASRP
jgi:EmrB/QacA subfamily drug resistance transporter